MRKFKFAWCLLVVLGFVWGFFIQGQAADARRVVVLPTVHTNQSFLAHYIHERVKEPFRYPYYELLRDSGVSVPLTRLDLARIADEYRADIVVAPELVHWNQFTLPKRDGDSYVRTSCIIRLYWYVRGDNRLGSVETRYFQTEEESIYTTEEMIIKKTMDDAMKQFPFRRIPDKLAEKRAQAMLPMR